MIDKTTTKTAKKKFFRCLILVSMTSLFFGQTTALSETLNELNQLVWKNRVLLIKPKLACGQEVLQLLENETEINDRDILWFVFCEEKTETNYSGIVSEKFANDIIKSLFIRDDVTIILVGKDGGVKRRAQGLELTRLFDLIDSMPMRQNEMQQ